MKTIRVMKIIISMSLAFVICLCSSVFASAYHPIIKIDSSDWHADTEDIVSSVYPSDSALPGLSEKIFQFSELNDETYYISKYWEDSSVVQSIEIGIPDYPSEDFNLNNKSVSSESSILLKCGNNLYLLCFYGFNMVYLTDAAWHNVKNLEFDVSGNTGEVFCYELSYPYTNWELNWFQSFHGNSDVIVFETELSVGVQSVDIVWSDTPVYSYSGSEALYIPDTISISSVRYVVEYDKPLTLLTGSLSCHIDSETFNRLSKTVSAILFDKFGFIIGTDTDYVDLEYSVTGFFDDVSSGTDTLFSYNYNAVGTSDYMQVGSKAILSELQILDFSTLDFAESGFNILITFSFASTGYNLFFPGNIEVVEYASFEETQQHKETIDAINNSTTEIVGAIDSAADKILNNEIGLEKIVFDTSSIDDYVADSDALMNDIYSDTDKLIQDNLPDGYNDYNSYLNDNIDYFNQNLGDAFSFIKDLFENFVDATGISYLILFCLSFGFAMYVLGRRLT